jgi:hypothetical protein
MNDCAANRHEVDTVSSDAPSGSRRGVFRPFWLRGPLAGGTSLVRSVREWMFSLLDESSSPLFTYRTHGT